MELFKRVGLVIFIVALPAVVYGLIFELILSDLVPQKEMSDTLMSAPDTATLFAREFPSRITLGLVCLVLAVSSLAGLFYAVWLAYRGAGMRIAAALGVIAVVAGGVSYLTNDVFDGREGGLLSVLNSDTQSTGERMRYLAQLPGMQDTSYDPAFQAEALTATGHVAALSALFGVAAAAALALAINGVGFGVFYGESKNSAAMLRIRWRQYRTVLVFASLIFAFSVAVLQLFYHWPLQLFALPEPTDKAALQAIANAKALVDSTVMFWAVLFSITLLLTTLPAFLALRMDIDRAAHASGETPEERKSWRDALGLTMISRDALGGALAILSPVLTAPVMDAFGRVLDLANFGS